MLPFCLLVFALKSSMMRQNFRASAGHSITCSTSTSSWREYWRPRGKITSLRARCQLRTKRYIMTWDRETSLKYYPHPPYHHMGLCGIPVTQQDAGCSCVTHYFLQAGRKPPSSQMLRRGKEAIGRISRDAFSATRDVTQSDNKGVDAQARTLQFLTRKDCLALDAKLVH